MSRIVIKTRKCPVCDYKYQVRESYTSKAEQNGGKEYDDWWLPDDNYYKDFLVDSKVIEGDVDFKMLENPTNMFSREGDPYTKVNYLGMFCPKCGVFLDIDICTQTKEVEE